MTEPKLKFVLSDFQGPLDLLLHLIKESKINIYDIPISEITSQYMDYLHHMKKMHLDIAGDYLVMASTLMRIKSKMLLPKSDLYEDEDDFEVEDPREDLVAQLLAYQTYKNVSNVLAKLERERMKYHSKPVTITKRKKIPFLKPGVKVANDLAVTMNDLLSNQNIKQTTFTEIKSELSVEDSENNIMKKLEPETQVYFRSLLDNIESTDEIVTKFMAILELIKNQMIECFQKNYHSDILVQMR